MAKGIITNFLSPNPWLFWFTVGAATVLKARQSGWLAVVVFFAIFYLLLCGIKGAIAVVTGQSREFIGGRAHTLIVKALGLALVGFALLLFRDAVRYLAPA